MHPGLSDNAIARLSEEGRGGGNRLLVTLPLLEGGGCQELHLSDLVDDDVGVRLLFASMNDPRYSRRNRWTWWIARVGC
jgi:hypothetical protein